MVTSGIRLGSPAGTTRGFGIAEFQQIGRMIAEVLDGLAANGEAGNGTVEAKVKAQAIALASASRSTPDFARANSGCRAVQDIREHLVAFRRPHGYTMRALPCEPSEAEGGTPCAAPIAAAQNTQVKDSRPTEENAASAAAASARTAAAASPPSSGCSCAS